MPDKQQVAQLVTPILQRLFDFRQEPICGCAVQDAMVEDERQINHGADGDGVVAFFIGYDDRALLHCPDSQNPALRLVDDWKREQRSTDSMIGECEGTAFDIIWI